MNYIYYTVIFSSALFRVLGVKALNSSCMILILLGNCGDSVFDLGVLSTQLQHLLSHFFMRFIITVISVIERDITTIISHLI